MAISSVISPALFLLFIWFMSTSAYGSDNNGTNSNTTNNNYTLVTKWGTKGIGDGQLMFPHSIACRF